MHRRSPGFVALTFRCGRTTVGVVPIGSVVVCLVIAGLALAESRSRAAREWRWVALVALVGLAIVVFVRGGVDTSRLIGKPLVLDLILAALGLLIAIDLIGLPLPLARRLRLGLHSREWEFHRRLYALTEEARRSAHDPDGTDGDKRSDLPDIIARMRSLRAPNQDWAELRDAWALLWERYHAAHMAPFDDLIRMEYIDTTDELVEQTNRLSARYRADSARIVDKDS